MQVFVKLVLLDYILLDKYKDSMQALMQGTDSIGLEKLYETNG